MAQKYVLEIQKPDIPEQSWMVFQSRSPFASISPGDLINPAGWLEVSPNILRVVNVEHFISKNSDGGTTHTIRVFSTAVPNTHEERQTPRPD